jgi:hypothetical protein
MKILLTIFLFFSIEATSQIDKKTWLVGGTGNFLSYKNTYSNPTFSYTSDRVKIKISPNIGYFPVNKLGIGLRPSYSKYKDVVNGSGGVNSNENRFELGPFIRYYFLSAEKRYNILTDMCYQYGIYWFKPVKGNINTFSASAGTVVFFNSSVGLEFLLGYYSRNEVIQYSTNVENVINYKGFQIGIGFQIHLEN